MKANSANTDTTSNILKVYNAKSTINSYYDMSAPIQFTLSYCSGLTDEDFFNIMTISPRANYFHTSPVASLFHTFNSRPPHYHSFFELVIVLEGSISQRIEDKEYIYPAGTCCLINQNVLHVEKYTGEHKLADKLLYAMMYPKLGSTYLIKGLVCNLFQYLDTPEFYHISEVTLNSGSDLVLFSRIGHLMEDTCGRMSRSDLERILCYSGNYMNTIIKKHTGMCLYDYGLTFTLKKAAALLSDTPASISSIAIQMGFSNRTHFYKLFRENTAKCTGFRFPPA